jgi:hypothetical protein
MSIPVIPSIIPIYLEILQFRCRQVGSLYLKLIGPAQPWARGQERSFEFVLGD